MGVVSDRLMINQCFYHFKHLYKDMIKKKGSDKDGKYSGPNFGNAPMSSPTKGGEKAIQNEEQAAEV